MRNFGALNALRTIFNLCFGTLLLSSCCIAADADQRIRLKDGSFSTGRLTPSEIPGTIGWHADGFEDSFSFDLNAVRSISSVLPTATFPPAETVTTDSSELLFELVDGAMLVGTLVAMDSEWVQIDSKLAGRLRLARDQVLTMVDGGYAGQVVYSGPVDDERWIPISDAMHWEFQAGTLVANQQRATIVGDVGLPAKSQISLTLSWRGVPDFVISLGTLATNKVSAVDEVPSAARLEIWDQELVLVREVDGAADIAMLMNLSGLNQRVTLTVYLDQLAGRVVVCDAHGRPLQELSLATENPSIRSSIHISNTGPGMAVERLEVRNWDGITTTSGEGRGQVVLEEDGRTLSAEVSGFDAANQEVVLLHQDDTESSVPLAEIRRADIRAVASLKKAAASQEALNAVDFPPPVIQPPPLGSVAATEAARERASADKESSTQAAEHPPKQETELPVVEVILSDRSRLHGQWLPTIDGRARFQAVGIAEVLAMDISAVYGLIGTNDRHSYDLTAHKNGTLKLRESQLAGYLEEENDQASHRAVRWHPHGSREGCSVTQDANGAIVYRAPLPKLDGDFEEIRRAQPTVLEGIQMFLGGRGPTGLPGSDLVATESGSERTPREISFRSGDAINAVIESIDESGVTFSSAQTNTTFATHSQMQHAWINANTQSKLATPEKLQRLMTVPRSMKQDPPTHLLVSNSGDYLRGRLLSLDESKLTVEIRLSILELPVSEVAQIIWLHDRDWDNTPPKKTSAAEESSGETAEVANATSESSDAATEPPEDKRFRVHAIRSSDRGLTFVPTGVSSNSLHGDSDLLGGCKVRIQDVHQLLFGTDIAEAIREFRDDPWTLSLAQYPRAFLEDGDTGGNSMGEISPLVGELAPDFGLDTLAGESFRLSKHRDRIVVLDFWASWCGPCVQSMPLVEAAVAEFGADQVELVAVNIQETPARIQAAVERLGLSATVLLDVDGQVAAAYQAQAIPQTVVIDREGKVTHLFVGGGSRFIAQFKAALESVLPQ